jgi:integrase/recombinase XerC
MSVDVFKVGSVYHYRFQVCGKRVQRTTREKNKRRADLVADSAYRDAVERANGGEPIPKLHTLIDEWKDLRAVHSSEAHVKSVDTFARLHLHGLGEQLICDLDTTTVERARRKHLEGHNFASTNHWLRVLKLLVNWAVKRKILPRLPWSVPMLPVQKKPRAILPLAAAVEWFAAVDKATPRAPGVGVAVRLMLWLGLRESEAITARWEWIDWQRGTYTPGKTKGKEADPLRMPRWLADYLFHRRQPEGLIARHRDGQQFGAGFARAAIRSANQACQTKGITPHRLRGTIATLMSEEGVPVQTVQKFLRHKDVRTTMAYLERNMDRIDTAQEHIAEKIGMTWRESGEDQAANPHVASDS